MSIFDPYSLYKNRQKHCKKGQVLQKKPITNLKAYTKKDLEEAYCVLHAYGIPYGGDTPTTVNESSTFENYTLTDSMLWETNHVGATLNITNKQLMDLFWAQSGLGHWVATELDLSKVISYRCTISSGTVTYYYDISQRGDVGFYYALPVTTEDRASTYSVTLNVPEEDPEPPTAPSNRIIKTISSYVDANPRLFLEVKTFTQGGQVQYWVQEAPKNYTGAIYQSITNGSISIVDFVNGNYEPVILASTYTTGAFTHNTDACISSVVDIYFTIRYTD